MSDKIEKTVLLAAPMDRVWRALTDHREFGSWFGVELEAPFEVGAIARGRITHKGYEHVVWQAVIKAIDPPDYFAFSWHPYAIDPKIDYSGEKPTLVEFRLEPVDGSTRLTVVESGFSALPEYRQPDALRMNGKGWEIQMENIKAHVER